MRWIAKNKCIGVELYIRASILTSRRITPDLTRFQELADACAILLRPVPETAGWTPKTAQNRRRTPVLGTGEAKSKSAFQELKNTLIGGRTPVLGTGEAKSKSAF